MWMLRDISDIVCVDNGLDMEVRSSRASFVMPQDSPLFWPGLAATGAHKHPVHSQACEVLVPIQQRFETFLLPAQQTSQEVSSDW